MEKFYDILCAVSLFRDIDRNDISSMLKCLAAETVAYKKNEIILMAGDKPKYVGVVLAGAVHVVKEDYEGNRTIMATLSAGELFAEALCCAKVAESPVTVVVDEPATVLLLKFSRFGHTCANACEFHQKLIDNMLEVIAKKNLFLQNRMELARLKTIREKVLNYLEPFAAKAEGHFRIPLNREEMADYLCVERSALSHELMKMKREGFIAYHKNEFELL